ncbi:helix-turn-helix domain-containing protein, partial [Rhodopirellula sallentina]|uniref:helix-turn-helix domain-containing protein n=1 Tax=Rhodopirellula sallentina TaxID=1263869 RepID=UPI0005C7C6C8
NVVPIEIPALRHRREDIPSLVSFFLDYYNDINDRYVTHIDPDVMLALQEYHWPGNVRELQNYVERAVVMSDTDELTLDLLPTCVTSGEPLINEFGGSFPGAEGGLGLPAGVPGEGVSGTDQPGIPPAASAMSGGGMSGTLRTNDPNAPAVSPAAYADRMDVKTLTRFVVSRGLAEADDDDNVHECVVDQVEKELIAQVLAQCGGVQTKAAARLGMNRNTLYKKIKQYELG